MFPSESSVHSSSPAPPASATSGLGSSIGISYQVTAKCSWDWFATSNNQYNDIVTYGVLSYMQANDGATFTISGYRTNAGTTLVIISFTIDSPYTSLTQVAYDIAYSEAGGAWETDDLYLYIRSASSQVAVQFPDSDGAYDTGTAALSSAYVIDAKIHGELYLFCADAGSEVDSWTIAIDQLSFSYSAVTETRRSSYEIVGGTIRYAVDWDCWDYAVTTTLTPPTAWTFQDVNPDCTQASNVFACLVPISL